MWPRKCRRPFPSRVAARAASELSGCRSCPFAQMGFASSEVPLKPSELDGSSPSLLSATALAAITMPASSMHSPKLTPGAALEQC